MSEPKPRIPFRSAFHGVARFVVFGLASAVLMTGCNIQFRNKDYRPPKPKDDGAESEYWKQPRDIQIGQVTFIGESEFVLLANKKHLALPIGQRLYAEGQGGRSTLKVTTERTQTHLSADILKGKPQVGDLVVYRHRPGHVPTAGDGGDDLLNQPTGIRSVPLDLEDPLPPLP